MKKKTVIVLIAAILVGVFLFTGCAPKPSGPQQGINNPGNAGPKGPGNEQNNGMGLGPKEAPGNGPKGNEQRGNNLIAKVESLPKESLSLSEKEAMETAIQDEYKARDFYLDVMAKFGDVTPFVNIEKAEERHIAALVALFEKYDLPVPADNSKTAADKLMENVKTLKDACKIGVQGEIENKDMYAKLFKMIDNEDIKLVFERLQSASENNHLPAFQRCANGG